MQQAPVVSPDGYWMWNGTQWVPNTPAAATPAVRQPVTSPDGMWMWNGAQWVPNIPRAAAAPYVSASFRAMLVTLFLTLTIVGLVLYSAWDIVHVAYLSDSSGDQRWEAADGLLAIFTLVAYYGSLITTIVFFCMWLHRVVRNMPALGSPDPRWSPSGAVWRCFIPFVLWVHPLRSVLDAWRGAWSGGRWVDVTMRKSMRAPALIVGWWTAWLLGGLLGNVEYTLSGRNNVGLEIASAYVGVVDNVLLTIAAALAILVVRRLTARQDARNHLITSGQLA